MLEAILPFSLGRAEQIRLTVAPLGHYAEHCEGETQLSGSKGLPRRHTNPSEPRHRSQIKDYSELRETYMRRTKSKPVCTKVCTVPDGSICNICKSPELRVKLSQIGSYILYMKSALASGARGRGFESRIARFLLSTPYVKHPAIMCRPVYCIRPPNVIHCAHEEDHNSRPTHQDGGVGAQGCLRRQCCHHRPRSARSNPCRSR